MESRFKFLPLLLLLSFHAFAEDGINNLIKQQQNADLNTFKEQKVYRQDVYSSTERKVFRLNDLPQEENCFTITSLVLKMIFYSVRPTGPLKKRSWAAV